MDIHSLLFGEEDLSFLAEVAIRAVVMFFIVLFSLRLLGKRGVRQLSILELVIIISLGSAGGDAIFYKNVGLLVAIMVFVMVVALYLAIVYWAEHSRTIDALIGGKPVLLVEEGVFRIKEFKRETISIDEFFSELRTRNVSHLGQVYRVYHEMSGELSIFYYPDEEILYGLPIYPESLEANTKLITQEGIYACLYCGRIQTLKPVAAYTCPSCNKARWVPASNEKRLN